jgi:hypothetical protein
MTGKRTIGLISTMVALWVLCPCIAQKPAADSSEPHEMLMTRQGFIAIDTPKGWVQSEGPGLASFLPKGVDPAKAEVLIYISSAPVGEDEEDKDMNAYIQSDITGFKQRFKNGIVRKEENLLLPEVKGQASVYTFQSGEAHNAFEQIVYISDFHRVLILALSAKNLDALTQSTKLFHEFAESYRGSIQMGSPDGKSH